MAQDETYEGWTNRETWAVALHINNDQGWQESVREALHDGPYGSEGFNLAEAREAFYNAPESIARMAGELIQSNVEETLTPLDSDDYYGCRLTDGQWGAIQDIGSLWRVNWRELGASFLEDLDEQ